MERIILYNKDLQLLTGKSEKTCYRIMMKIRLQIGKPSDAPITITDVCTYWGFRLDEVRVKLR